jgi:hypothetical protein
VFRLINESQQGKTDARAGGVLAAATSVYDSESAAASADARSIARELASQPTGATDAQLQATVSTLAARSGLARVVVRVGPRTVVDVGDQNALAPGSASVRERRMTVLASELSAVQYVRALARTGGVLLVRQGGVLLSASVPHLANASVPQHGSVKLDGASYRALSRSRPGFGPSPVLVTALASASAGGSVTGSRALAIGLIVGFLLLALSFSV